MSNKEEKERKKNHYVKIITKKEPIHPEELKKHGFKRVRYDYLDELVANGTICRKKFGRDYTLLFIPGHDTFADERFSHDSSKKRWGPFNYQKSERESRMDYRADKPDIRKIDEMIVKLFKESNKIPPFEEIATELVVDLQNPDVRGKIYKRLSKINEVKQSTDKIIKNLYKSPPPSPKSHYNILKNNNRKELSEPVYSSIKEGLPSDEKVIEELKLKMDISDIETSIADSLIFICKENFMKKKAIIA